MKFVYAIWVLCLSLVHSTEVFSQQKNTIVKNQAAQPGKNYPSLLWEISGNGLSRPSYLFGTMHISNKMVFNLSDSFYNAIKSVDVVALEQNPEVWQEAYSKEASGDDYENIYSRLLLNYHLSGKRLTQQTFAISNYESKIQLGLASEARMVNGMLYRSTAGQEDFEEETYLDMYIYRLGRKLNKMVTGVEDYRESNRLVKEAYRDMYKEKKPARTYDVGYDYRRKMEEAYRRGDLDMLDSLQEATSVSDAFNEKFLFRRNYIQANSIDTIIKKHALFAGVGAAHLPGQRGVIALLRKKGYRVRPVYIGQRNSEEKDKLEKIRVPVVFKKQYAEDSLFSVEIPGEKFFRFAALAQTNMLQYADMANGSYYMVTRIKTNASLLGQSAETVLHKTDSLLYENIPGRIISKKTITKNGLTGFDILNRTRKGDEQRYNIFILPNELVIFKVSAVGEYVTGGKEAEQFLSSIIFDSSRLTVKPVAYQPVYGGFGSLFPSLPAFTPEKRNDKARSEWICSDSAGNNYFIFKTTLHQYDYIEEDSFELRLMEESFTSSPFISKATPGKTGAWKNYPVIDAVYTHTDGSFVKVRYLLQGANYFVIGSKYQRDATAADAFINSFAITPTRYGPVQHESDTTLGFTVNTPLFYPSKDSSDDFSLRDLYTMSGNDEEGGNAYIDLFESTTFKTIVNDTTGECISLLSFRFPAYTYLKDSAALKDNRLFFNEQDSDFIITSKKELPTSNKWLVTDYSLTDTGSSRVINIKSFYKDGVLFRLANLGDTVTPRSTFVQSFFSTFTPVDTFKIFDVFKKKSTAFFEAYFSKDSAARKKAIRSMDREIFDASDLPQIKNAIAQLSWNQKNYLSLKKEWIDITGSFKDTATVNYLSGLYVLAKDTSELQNALLDALLNMRTNASFMAFKQLVLSEPPVVFNSKHSYNSYRSIDQTLRLSYDGFSPDKHAKFIGYKWAPLYDTVALSATIIPAMTDLMMLDDYKDDMLQLLSFAVDSGYILPAVYKQHFNKFLLDAKQQVKKQKAKEDEQEISKLERNEEAGYHFSRFEEADHDNDLNDYAILLMPFWDQSADVPALFEKMLHLRDKDIVLSTAVTVMRHGKPVADSILNSLAADDHYRLILYNRLDAAGLTGKFPARYKNQYDISRGALAGFYYYSKSDSLVYIDRLQVNDNKHKGWIYFYKYKKSKDDKEWFLAYSGLQPADTTQVNAKFNTYKNDFLAYSNKRYSSTTVGETLAQLLKENLYSLRQSAAQFYSRYTDEDMDAAAVEEIKGGRFE